MRGRDGREREAQATYGGEGCSPAHALTSSLGHIKKSSGINFYQLQNT